MRFKTSELECPFGFAFGHVKALALKFLTNFIHLMSLWNSATRTMLTLCFGFAFCLIFKLNPSNQPCLLQLTEKKHSSVVITAKQLFCNLHCRRFFVCHVWHVWHSNFESVFRDQHTFPISFNSLKEWKFFIAALWQKLLCIFHHRGRRYSLCGYHHPGRRTKRGLPAIDLLLVVAECAGPSPLRSLEACCAHFAGLLTASTQGLSSM